MKYDWGITRPYGDVDAQVVGEHLEALVEKYKEHLTDEEILADARSARSPIHNCFEWSDSKAAEKWRRKQARSIVSTLIAKVPGEHKTRAFVFVQMPGEGRKSYIPLRSAMGRPELRDQVIQNALKPLERWITSYGGRPELSFVKKRVEALRDRIGAELLSAAGLSKN